MSESPTLHLTFSKEWGQLNDREQQIAKAAAQKGYQAGRDQAMAYIQQALPAYMETSRREAYELGQRNPSKEVLVRALKKGATMAAGSAPDTKQLLTVLENLSKAVKPQDVNISLPDAQPINIHNHLAPNEEENPWTITGRAAELVDIDVAKQHIRAR